MDEEFLERLWCHTVTELLIRHHSPATSTEGYQKLVRYPYLVHFHTGNAENPANNSGSAQWKRNLGGTIDASPPDAPSAPWWKPEPFLSRRLFLFMCQLVCYVWRCAHCRTPVPTTTTTSTRTEKEPEPEGNTLTDGFCRPPDSIAAVPGLDWNTGNTWWVSTTRWYPCLTAGGLEVINDKKINTSLKAGHMYESHAELHAHFISGKQSAVSGKLLSADVLPSHVEHNHDNHDVNSTSRKGRKPSDPAMFCLFGL